MSWVAIIAIGIIAIALWVWWDFETRCWNCGKRGTFIRFWPDCPYCTHDRRHPHAGHDHHDPA
jgi:hypothetical protein